MTLSEWLAWQQRVHPRAIDLTLDRVTQVLESLGCARPNCPVITVGGTNGKGSVTALLDSVLGAAGRRVGLFTSPHLSRYTERIRIAGREVEEAALIAAFERVEAARGDVTLTYFEYSFAAAACLFQDARLDAWILEVGLGGRFDAVNAVSADVAVIVSIGLDHTDWLGDTLEAIGREKAGILRAGRPAIYGSRVMPESIGSAATAMGAPLSRLGRDYDGASTASGWNWRHGEHVHEDLSLPALAGAVQIDNAATALSALAVAPGELLPERAAIDIGLRQVRLAGRFQIVPGEVEWVFDVAHNAPAAIELARNLQQRPINGRTIAVAGILRDKDIDAIVGQLSGTVHQWLAVGLDGERALPAAELAARLQFTLGQPVIACDSVAAGCKRARELAQQGDRILVFGSFLTVGPALEWLGLYTAGLLNGSMAATSDPVPWKPA